MKPLRMAKVIIILLVMSMFAGVLSGCAASPYPYELDEYITVPDSWKEMSVTESEISVRVNDMIQNARENAAIKESVVSRPSEEGDLGQLL